MNSRSHTSGQRVGFTLVELLVVIAIVAVLMGILMPSLSAARSQARQLICRSNLRAVFTGVLMYAQDHANHVPLIEPMRLPEDEEEDGNPDDPTDPNDDPTHQVAEYDPFDPQRPQALGMVLGSYVEPGSWRCPLAVAGYPRDASSDRWTLTYSFRTAQRDPEGELIPFGDAGLAYLGQGGATDPVISNYSQFDGRPLRYLNGRRFVFFASGGGQPVPNYNYEAGMSRYWAVRWPLVWDTLGGRPDLGAPQYPHRGRLEPRPDLAEAQQEFNQKTNYSTAATGYLALFADRDVTETRLTRDPLQHEPGF